MTVRVAMKAPVILLAVWWTIVAGNVVRGAEREMTKVFAVQPGGTVQVDSYRGSITVDEGDAPEVRITVQFDFNVDTEAEAERLRAELQLDVKQEENAVVVTARNPSETGFRLSWQDQVRMELNYQIAVPRACNLTLKTASGNITVGRVAGRMIAEVEKGSAFFRQVDGSIDARARFGNIVISRCSGAVTARVLRGSISGGTLAGAADLKATNGAIDVLMVRDACTALAEAGDVTVGFPSTIAQPAKITASGGTITAKIDPTANCDVAASALWGAAKCALPLTGEGREESSRRITGRLNRGGPLLTFRANGGSVKIEPGETLFE